MPVPIDTTLTAPAEVVPGDAVRSEAGRATVELPTYLAQFGYFELTATTTITVDHADHGRFLAATPFEYTTPVIPALDWTAVGGDVTIAQDAGGHLPQLPLAPAARCARSPARS
jgi:hypothetical protein